MNYYFYHLMETKGAYGNQFLKNIHVMLDSDLTQKMHTNTSITPFGATNGASEIVSLARAKLRPGNSN